MQIQEYLFLYKLRIIAYIPMQLIFFLLFIHKYVKFNFIGCLGSFIYNKKKKIQFNVNVMERLKNSKILISNETDYNRPEKPVKSLSSM